MSGRLLTNQAYSPRSFSKSNTRMTCCRTGRCLNCVCVCVPSTFHSDLETVLIPLKLPIAPNDMPVQPLIVPNITPSNRPTASQNLLHTPLPRPGDAILHSLNLSPLQTLQTPCLLGGNTTVCDLFQGPPWKCWKAFASNSAATLMPAFS